ncbi:hypothetical protein CAC42_2795 [Sphaceloma murrayae]|uniref:Amine oxidase domain-containing protein n=1 Tax=Sphaceloma murrayae TaxID=2082308 RepID=A0A2K1R0N8_9PEZI|nr:hypothetical protein CAC42_2795 [Sphaceloma murrayae]
METISSSQVHIINRIAKPAQDRGIIRLSSEVVCIKSLETVTDIRPRLVVETADGAKEAFDEVVVTVPLGCLKSSQIRFEPPLQDPLRNAISAFGTANLDKVYVRFPAAFWQSDAASQDDASAFPIETLFLKPTYAESTNPAQWRQETLSLASLPRGYSQPSLVFYVYGEWGTYITNLVRNMPRDTQEYHQTMDRHFRPYYSKLPNYNPSEPQCRPAQYLHTDWSNDRFAGYASYCNYQVGLGDGARDIETLRQGAGVERGIWFAGDHTAPVWGLGTVAGAHWSGERVAEQIRGVYANKIAAT